LIRKSSSSIGKGYENYQSVDVLRKKLNNHISKHVILFAFILVFQLFLPFRLQSSRSKRDAPKENDPKNVKNNLFVKLLVVLDSTVYSFFQHNFGYLGNSTLNDYIKLFFCHVINGVNTVNNLSYLIVNFLFFLR
jgi:Na+/H+ antiporter NhaD/arsenite permease-like protein